jgi:hypothetical protein
MARLLLIGTLIAEADSPASQPDADAAVAALTPSDCALLVLLTSHKGSHRVRKVIETMWPDEGEWDVHFDRYSLEADDESFDPNHALTIDEAIGNVRAAIGRLRTLVKHLTSDEPPSDVVRTTRQQTNRPGSGSVTFLAPGGLYVDVHDFQTQRESDRWRCIEITRGPMLREHSHAFLDDERRRQRETIQDLITALLPASSAGLISQLTYDVYQWGHNARVKKILRDRARPRSADSYQAPSGLSPRMEADTLTAAATSTLKELLSSWIGDPTVVRAEGDAVVHATCPSLWADVPPIEMKFVVFSADANRRTIASVAGIADECRVINAEESIIDSLRDYIEDTRNIYFVLATPRHEKASLAGLYDLPPHERFEWLAVDGAQLLLHDASGAGQLAFPCTNRLNLSQFSLLWSARWVQAFFTPLEDTVVQSVVALQQLADHVFPAVGAGAQPKNLGWQTLTDDLPKFAPQLDPDVFKQVSFRVGLGLAFDLICGQLTAAAGTLDQIRTYCPEALYGTANLWLFSRIYQRFMRQSSLVAADHRQFINQRLLPINAHEMTTAPRVFMSALWHVVISYRVHDADIRLVDSHDKHAGEDHSYYGAGIGYFPWVSMTPDQAHWMVGTEVKGDTAHHLDFLKTFEHNSVVTPQLGENDIAVLFDIPLNQLLLPAVPPVMLLPPENRYIEYPRSLWAPGSRGARLRGVL